jgi:predicted DNA-binding transcriptional regulator YafY
MPRKKEALTLSVPPGTKEQLEAIASRLNILWGKKPSPSGLIVAIAQQQLDVGQRFTLSSVQVQSLEQAAKLLIDSGYIPEAQTLIALVLDRGNLEPPQRQSLLQQVSQPVDTWRKLLDRQIENRQPFRLYYQDSQNRGWEFIVRHAHIKVREKRFYLETWNEQTEGNFDIPELAHNRSLRLDRITNLGIVPTEGEWRDNQDLVKVQLHFYRGLARAYEAKAEDISDTWDGNVRNVVKEVSNTFWLIREVFRYAEDCEIVSPESVRDRIKQKLKSLCNQYNLTIVD